MEVFFESLMQAYRVYRQDIEEYQRKSRPTDGLFGFGRALKDDICHDRFDRHVEETVKEMAENGLSGTDAERAVRMLLFTDNGDWPLAAQWMLRAVERHCIPLVPYLAPDAAAALYREYAERYPPWDRLPVQKELLKMLKRAGKA